MPPLVEKRPRNKCIYLTTYMWLSKVFENGVDISDLNPHPYQEELCKKMDKEIRKQCVWTVRQG